MRTGGRATQGRMTTGMARTMAVRRNTTERRMAKRTTTGKKKIRRTRTAMLWIGTRRRLMIERRQSEGC